MSALLLAVQTVTTTADAITVTAKDSGGDSGLLTALIGGAVGVLLTALARALGIPTDVRAHDAAIADRDDALATWVADRSYALEQASKAIVADMNPRPTKLNDDGPGDAFDAIAAAAYRTQASSADIAIASARSAALHEYRDEERRAKLDRATVLAGEGWAHRLWRRARRHPAPQLNTPVNATQVLDSWRRPSQLISERPRWPDDATKRTLADAVAAAEVLRSEA